MAEGTTWEPQVEVPPRSFSIVSCFSNAGADVRNNWPRGHRFQPGRNDKVREREASREVTDCDVIDGILG